MFSSKRLISLSVLSTFLTLASALPIEPPTCSTTRVVQSGDTCEAIANAAGIPVSTLLANNPAVNSGCTNLFIGQVLCTAIQAAQAGDTCEAIASAAGIPVSTLLANNPAINSGCTNLFIGQILCTAVQTTSPPPTQTATATATPTPTPPTCSTTRVVQPGDTCEAIANAAGISVSTLLANNPAINSGCTNLFIGQVLCTASPTTPRPRDSTGTCSTTRVVQSGDTCEAIAKAAGISVSTLLANNPAVNSGCTNLFIGQVLCIANQPTQPPPPPATCNTTRVVQAGDTCEAIANAAGIPVLTLLANNPASTQAAPTSSSARFCAPPR
ncbi:hypothetical protein BC826DRAFT_968608 [Russula brevipes]|nr:hypothetical protein BC826DRAFT_968608 [Russula brevipes]